MPTGTALLLIVAALIYFGVGQRLLDRMRSIANGAYKRRPQSWRRSGTSSVSGLSLDQS